MPLPPLPPLAPMLLLLPAPPLPLLPPLPPLPPLRAYFGASPCDMRPSRRLDRTRQLHIWGELCQRRRVGRL